jgi:hypothetical protein
MRTTVKGNLFGALAAIILLAVGTVALAADDFAVFTLETQTRVGHVILEPGGYAFRAVDGMGGKVFVRVTSADETRSFAIVRVLRESVLNSEMVSDHQLTFDKSEPGRLLRWEVGMKSYSLYFPKSGLEP